MCTEFILPRSTGPRVSGRTMDFAKEFDWRIAAVPKGTEQSAVHLPRIHKHPAAKWEAQYAFMGIGEKVAGDLFETKTTDAMNDQGLSAAALWLPGSEYPRVTNIPETTSLISCLDICSWAVSNYATVEALRVDLEHIAAGEPTEDGEHLAFWDPLQMPEELTAIGAGEVTNYLPLHFQFHDRDGNSLVLEFRDQKMELTDNGDLGVMTNAPFIDWQRTNLSNYLSVTNVEVESGTVVDMSVNRSGNGGGTLGLSTSPLPPDRFVRAAFLLDFAKPWLAEKGRTEAEGAAFALNLIGNIAVPREMCIDKAGALKGDYTQWKLIRDHANNRFYIATADSIGSWSVDFADYALGKGEPVRTVPLINAANPPALPN